MRKASSTTEMATTTEEISKKVTRTASLSQEAESQVLRSTEATEGLIALTGAND